MALLWLGFKLLLIRRLHLRAKYVRIPQEAWDELQLKVLQAEGSTGLLPESNPD